MVSAGFNGRVSFGPFLLDGGTRELRCGVDPIHLTPKAFELISMLIEQRPASRHQGGAVRATLAERVR